MSGVDRYAHLRRIRGYAVIEDDRVRLGKALFMHDKQAVVVREVAHFSWQVQMAYLADQIRMRVDAMLAKFARDNGVAPRASSE